MIKIPKYYELFDKLDRCKKKHKEDTSKLQSEIKKHIEMIDRLKSIIKERLSEDYYYNLWLKEREERIKITKESNKLLDEVADLKEKLTIKIMAETLKKS